MKLTFTTGSEAYPALMRELLVHGTTVAPRKLSCRELCDATVCITEASQAVPVASGRTINKRIGAAEYCQLLAGVSWLSQLDHASHGRFAQFANGNRLRGAYGPRVYDQLPLIAEKLEDDRDSRQAVLVIHNGMLADSQPGQRDVPCTVAVQYRIRSDRLDATVIMRSSDAYIGLPYDFWMQSRLQMTLAWALGCQPGSFTFFAGSLHLYEKDTEKAAELRWDDSVAAEQPPALTCNYYQDTSRASERVMDAQDAAEQLVLGRLPGNTIIPGSGWYSRLLPQTAVEHFTCVLCRYIHPEGETCRCRDGTSEEEKDKRKR